MDGDYADPGAGDGTWFHLTDAQFSTAALADGSGAVAERVSYSAYGVARHHWPGDVDGDGAVTTSGGSSDSGIVSAIASATLADRTVGGSAYRAEADLDRSGVIDGTDATLVGSALAALPAGQLSSVDVASGAADSAVGWDGYLYSPECALYEVRFRVYEPLLGRWVERDPAGYVDAANVYLYGRSSPVIRIDSSGGRSSSTENFYKRSRPYKPWVDTGTKLGERAECECCAEELHIILLDWGIYRDQANEVLNRAYPTATKVRNRQDVLNHVRQRIRDAEAGSGKGCVCIRELRFLGHGFAGGTSIGGGTLGSEDETNPEGDPTEDMYMTELTLDYFKEFAPYMCPEGSVEFASCSSGDPGGGVEFLQKAHEVFGCETIGYRGLVYVDPIRGTSPPEQRVTCRSNPTKGHESGAQAPSPKVKK